MLYNHCHDHGHGHSYAHARAVSETTTAIVGVGSGVLWTIFAASVSWLGRRDATAGVADPNDRHSRSP
jgi:hypothetical protein